MGYYHENGKSLDVSGLFPMLKNCVAAAELISDREKTSYRVYAQTSSGDMLVGKTSEYIGERIVMWCFDFSPDWPFNADN